MAPFHVAHMSPVESSLVLCAPSDGLSVLGQNFKNNDFIARCDLMYLVVYEVSPFLRLKKKETNDDVETK